MRVMNMLPIAVLLVFLGACGGGDASQAAEGRGGASASSVASEPSVPLTGNVVEVRMISGRGEIFEPSEFTVRRGDIVRFVLESGVHNASFPADRNPAGVALPPPGPYLQLPGQTYDVTVDMPPGEYFFQCDPHAALGMVGTMTVEE